MVTNLKSRARWTRRVALGLALLALAGCTARPPGAPAAASRGGEASTLLAAEGPEPGLDEPPSAVIHVPAAPLRRAAPLTRANAARAFVSPAETLPALLDLIRGARRSLYLETFNFGYDSYGRRIVPLLVEKARAGVEVRVVMDYCGSRFLPGHRALVQELRAGGVEVLRYLPRTIRKDDRMVGINIQHRKVYLADGARALVGGVNLMREFDTVHQDLLVALEGPVVADLHREFALDHRAAGGKATLTVPPVHPGQGTATARVVVTSPAEGRFEARDAILAGIDAARHTIDIENQYLWDDRLIGRLYAALERGVRVRLIVPGEEHKAVFKQIHAEELQRLVARGAEARLYHGDPADAHLHAKYYQVDAAWVAVGSTNGDTRALMDNQELQVVLEDARLAADLRTRLFEHDWTRRSVPFVYRPSTVFTGPFRRLLELIDYYM
ncbi:MAG: phosphatidylserine/phosphatidylglycerophosphate/cardiolipin synthase family protein [Candidatus Sericytochromatia bacterium]|nr:phosphatidylserine/phosphatidylglycerophosphate/cardiolipin synthase family protein [Candidatus Sericytochromatia bacterium]